MAGAGQAAGGGERTEPSNRSYYIAEQILTAEEFAVMTIIRQKIAQLVPEPRVLADSLTYCTFNPDVASRQNFFKDGIPVAPIFSGSHNELLIDYFEIAGIFVCQYIDVNKSSFRFECIAETLTDDVQSNYSQLYIHQQSCRTDDYQAWQADYATQLIETIYRAHRKSIGKSNIPQLDWLAEHFMGGEHHKVLGKIFEVLTPHVSEKIYKYYLPLEDDIRQTTHRIALSFVDYFEQKENQPLICHRSCQLLQGEHLLSPQARYEAGLIPQLKQHRPEQESDKYVHFNLYIDPLATTCDPTLLTTQFSYERSGLINHAQYLPCRLYMLDQSNLQVSNTTVFSGLQIAVFSSSESIYNQTAKFVSYTIQQGKITATYREDPRIIADSKRHYPTWMAMRIEKIILSICQGYKQSHTVIDTLNMLQQQFDSPKSLASQTLLHQVFPHLEVRVPERYPVKKLTPIVQLRSELIKNALYIGRDNLDTDYFDFKDRLQSTKAEYAFNLFNYFAQLIQQSIKHADKAKLADIYTHDWDIPSQCTFNDEATVAIKYDKNLIYFYEHSLRAYITPLMLAVIHKNIEIARYLLAEIKVDPNDSVLYTGTGLALYDGKRTGVSALSFALDAPDIFDLLIEYSANPMQCFKSIYSRSTAITSQLHRHPRSAWPKPQYLVDSVSLWAFEGMQDLCRDVMLLMNNFGEHHFRNDLTANDHGLYLRVITPSQSCAGSLTLHPFQKSRLQNLLLQLDRSHFFFDSAGYWFVVKPVALSSICGLLLNQIITDRLNDIAYANTNSGVYDCTTHFYKGSTNNKNTGQNARVIMRNHEDLSFKIASAYKNKTIVVSIDHFQPFYGPEEYWGHLTESGSRMPTGIAQHAQLLSDSEQHTRIMKEGTHLFSGMDNQLREGLKQLLPENRIDYDEEYDEYTVHTGIPEVISNFKAQTSHYHAITDTFLINQIARAMRTLSTTSSAFTGDGGHNNRPGLALDHYIQIDNEFKGVERPIQWHPDPYDSPDFDPEFDPTADPDFDIDVIKPKLELPQITTRTLYRSSAHNIVWMDHDTLNTPSFEASANEFNHGSECYQTFAQMRAQRVELMVYSIDGVWCGTDHFLLKELSAALTQHYDEEVVVLEDLVPIGEQTAQAGPNYGAIHFKDRDEISLADPLVLYKCLEDPKQVLVVTQHYIDKVFGFNFRGGSQITVLGLDHEFKLNFDFTDADSSDKKIAFEELFGEVPYYAANFIPKIQAYLELRHEKMCQPSNKIVEIDSLSPLWRINQRTAQESTICLHDDGQLWQVYFKDQSASVKAFEKVRIASSLYTASELKYLPHQLVHESIDTDGVESSRYYWAILYAPDIQIDPMTDWRRQREWSSSANNFDTTIFQQFQTPAFMLDLALSHRPPRGYLPGTNTSVVTDLRDCFGGGDLDAYLSNSHYLPPIGRLLRKMRWTRQIKPLCLKSMVPKLTQDGFLNFITTSTAHVLETDSTAFRIVQERVCAQAIGNSQALPEALTRAEAAITIADFYYEQLHPTGEGESICPPN